ncbi:hypothetical protein NPIL_555481 [Nephila pilipes]|uniref:Uncharacterized protein n=1 Tax=Nephila pilipes TaxID=299642 RepID=A0A8X6P8C3_NEPPI|nr:hypothetical protein NPIL_555481 [Nephila pilipes]
MDGWLLSHGCFAPGRIRTTGRFIAWPPGPSGILCKSEKLKYRFCLISGEFERRDAASRNFPESSADILFLNEEYILRLRASLKNIQQKVFFFHIFEQSCIVD